MRIQKVQAYSGHHVERSPLSLRFLYDVKTYVSWNVILVSITSYRVDIPRDHGSGGASPQGAAAGADGLARVCS